MDNDFAFLNESVSSLDDVFIAFEEDRQRNRSFQGSSNKHWGSVSTLHFSGVVYDELEEAFHQTGPAWQRQRQQDDDTRLVIQTPQCRWHQENSHPPSSRWESSGKETYQQHGAPSVPSRRPSDAVPNIPNRRSSLDSRASTIETLWESHCMDETAPEAETHCPRIPHRRASLGSTMSTESPPFVPGKPRRQLSFESTNARSWATMESPLCPSIPHRRASVGSTRSADSWMEPSSSTCFKKKSFVRAPVRRSKSALYPLPTCRETENEENNDGTTFNAEEGSSSRGSYSSNENLLLGDPSARE